MTAPKRKPGGSTVDQTQTPLEKWLTKLGTVALIAFAAAVLSNTVMSAVMLTKMNSAEKDRAKQGQKVEKLEEQVRRNTSCLDKHIESEGHTIAIRRDERQDAEMYKLREKVE